jgi:hypothetical protein
MTNTYPNSGRLNWSKNKVKQDSPDLYGEINIDRAVLEKLLVETEGDSVQIRLSGWEKQGNYGPWFSIKINTWKKEPTLTMSEPAPQIPDGDVPF